MVHAIWYLTSLISLWNMKFACCCVVLHTFTSDTAPKFVLRPKFLTVCYSCYSPSTSCLSFRSLLDWLEVAKTCIILLVFLLFTIESLFILALNPTALWFQVIFSSLCSIFIFKFSFESVIGLFSSPGPFKYASVTNWEAIVY